MPIDNNTIIKAKKTKKNLERYCEEHLMLKVLYIFIKTISILKKYNMD